MMDIGCLPRLYINGRFLTQRQTGVQRFALEVVHALDKLLAHETAARRSAIVTPRGARVPSGIRHLEHLAAGRFAGGYAWEQVDLPMLTRDGVLLNLGGLAPVAKRRQVVVMHDASPKAVPQAFSRQFRMAYSLLVPAIAHQAAQLAAVSAFSRSEIARWYGIAASRFSVCHEGAEHILANPAEMAVLERNGLRPGGYLLAVGMGAANKNLPAILQAFTSATLNGARLALTGKRSGRVHGNSETSLPTGVAHCGFVSDAELRALYEGALALVYPSSYEGFGLPVVEAMACGCPVIASDQPALQEVAGDAAFMVPLDDPTALVQAMERIASDPGLRQDLARRGRERAASFTWGRTAERLLEQCRLAA
jgi:glycosyltransferase involved in cell wall biosynthesis